MDDLNALAEHAFAKNSPLNSQSKWRVENPHLCAYILIHAEELVPLLESDKDSVAGLQRFRYLHLPAVANKIRPEGADPEENGEQYCNNVSFDDAVLSAVHPELLLDRLYKQDVERHDEKDDKTMFSALSGLHTMKWSNDAW